MISNVVNSMGTYAIRIVSVDFDQGFVNCAMTQMYEYNLINLSPNIQHNLC